MIPDYTPEQETWLMAGGLFLLLALALAVFVFLGRRLVGRYGAGKVAAGAGGLTVLAVLVVTGAVRLVMWPVRAHRRGVARVRAAEVSAR